jgi:hypothetical protein
VTTLTPDQLAQLLRRWAAGCYSDEAAAQLLCDHRSWLTRSDFLATCVEHDHDGTTAVAWVVWDAIPAILDDTKCSSSEARILRLAAELAGHDTGTPLAELLSGLDDRNSILVADSITHALHLESRR